MFVRVALFYQLMDRHHDKAKRFLSLSTRSSSYVDIDWYENMIESPFEPGTLSKFTWICRYAMTVSLSSLLDLTLIIRDSFG